MISSCSKPTEDKESPEKKVSKTTQTEQTKVTTPEPVTEKPEAQPETPKIEVVEPLASKPTPETVVAKPEVPKPITAKPITPEPAKPEIVKQSNLTDTIAMESPAYKKHTKGIVLFTHKKHIEEYKIDCGECHHDKEGKPLNYLKANDEGVACIVCHTKLGQAPRPKDDKKLSQKEKLEYHAEAIHGNCIVCHKEHNKKTNTTAAPSSCNKCHPKNG